jgi:hypothetical protein
MTTYHWLAAFVGVNVLDAALTLYALKLGASELNPLMRLAMRVMPAPVALLAVKGAYIIAVGVMLADAAPWLPWLTAFFAAVCAWNVAQILKMRRNPTTNQEGQP